MAIGLEPVGPRRQIPGLMALKGIQTAQQLCRVQEADQRLGNLRYRESVESYQRRGWLSREASGWPFLGDQRSAGLCVREELFQPRRYVLWRSRPKDVQSSENLFPLARVQRC